MVSKEATARIKINKPLEAAGWRFFLEGSAPVNIVAEIEAERALVAANRKPIARVWGEDKPAPAEV